MQTPERTQEPQECRNCRLWGPNPRSRFRWCQALHEDQPFWREAGSNGTGVLPSKALVHFSEGATCKAFTRRKR